MRISLDVPFTLAEIAHITSAKQRGKNAIIRALTTDSRECEAGDLFIALRGEKDNGNAYLNDITVRGAYSLSSECEKASLSVSDAYKALLSIAKAYKEKCAPACTVAVTGSTGKTTVKEFIHKMLSTKLRVQSSRGNYNNNLGLSYTLLDTRLNTDVLVCELGMNHENEIKELSLALEPSFSVITNIGTAHIGMLGSREKIAKAKLEIECGMQGGSTVIWDDEPLLSEIKNPYRISERDKNADMIIRVLSKSHNGCELYVKTKDKEFISHTSLFASHHLKDLSFGIAICELLGFSVNEISFAVKSLTEELLRQKLLNIGKYSIYDDSYNSSGEAVIANLIMMEERFEKCSALLGDMLELGEESEGLHYSIGFEVARHNFKKLYAFGSFSRAMAAGARDGGMDKSNIFVNQNLTKPELTAKAIIESYDGETILAKASHSVKIDRIFKLISIMEGVS